MSAPNDMRKFIGYMYGKKPTAIKDINEAKKKDVSMRDMLGKMRKVNENSEVNISTNIDKASEEHKMNQYFEENNVTIDFEELKVFPNGVIFGGTIDGQLQFTYKVTPEEQSSGVEVNYLDGFDAQDPENEEVIKKIETYYDIFYKYWRSNLFQEN